MLPLHGWLGLITAGLIYLVAFTGTLCVFNVELDQWARPETRLAAATPPDFAALQRMLERSDASDGWVLSLPHQGDATGRATVFNTNGKLTFWFDATTGQSVKASIGPMAYLLSLHSRLTVRTWDIGFAVVTFGGMALLALLLSGLFLYPRLVADLFTLRIGQPLATLSTLHRLTGIFGLPFNVIVAVSGMVMLMPILAERPINALYHDEPNSFQRDLGATCERVSRPGGSGTDVQVAAIAARAQAHWSSSALGRLTYDAAGGTISVEPPREGNLSFERNRLCFEAATGKLIQQTGSGGRMQDAEQLLVGIHLTRYDKPLLRIAHFLSGGLLCGLICTGLLLWSESRRRAKQLQRGVEGVERWTIGVVLGLPVATLCYLCLDRLAPDAAVLSQGTFWGVWCTCMLAAVLRGRALCRPLIVCSSLLAGAAGVADHLATSKAVVPTFVNLTLIALGVAGLGLSAFTAKSVRQ